MRSKRYTYLLMAVLIPIQLVLTGSLANMRPNRESRAEGVEGATDVQSARRGGIPDHLDIPTIVVGDTWNYHTEMDITAEIDYGEYTATLDGELTGSSTYTAEAVQYVYANGTRYLCYNISLDGTYSLEAQDTPISANGNAEMDGYEYRKIDDLSLVRKDTFQTGSLIISIPIPPYQEVITYNLTNNETFKAPQEEYDFPLFPDEEWNQTYLHYSNYTGDLGGDPFDNVNIDKTIKNNSCTGVEEKDILSDYVTTYAVDIGDGSETRYFSGEMRNVVLTEVHSGTFLNSPDLRIDVESGTIRLVGKDLNQLPETLNVDIPQAVSPNGELTISGRTSGIFNGTLNLSIPGMDIALVGNVTEGSFTETISMDDTADSTPCVSDIGSHGLAVHYGDLRVYRVATVTLALPDIGIDPSKIVFYTEHEGILNTTVNINVTVENPTWVGISGLKLDLKHGGSLLESFDINITPLNSTTVRSEWRTVPPVGEHEFEVVLDPEDDKEEKVEDNNNATSKFTVRDRPVPDILNASPPSGRINMKEGMTKNLTAEFDELPGGEYNSSWWIKRKGVENYTLLKEMSGNLTFVSDFTGPNSSSSSPILIKFLVKDDASYEERSNHTVWNISVVNVNRRPIVLERDPSNVSVQMKENETMTFSVVAEDPDGLPTGYEWWLDGARLNVTGSSYSYNLTNDFKSSGNHTVKAVIRDVENNSLTEEVEWKVLVKNVNRNCQAKITMPVNDTFEEDQLINFSAKGSSDPDISPDKYGTLLNYQWDFGDGNSAIGMEVNHTYSDPDLYEVQLTVMDQEGGVSTVNITLNITKKEEPPAEDDGEDDEGTEKGEKLSPVYMTAGAFLIIGFLVLVVLWFSMELKRSKRRRMWVKELVLLEEDREEILEDIDRVKGRLEQIEWDLDDGYISRERHDHLSRTYRRRLDELRDELVVVEEKIEDYETKIKRPSKRKETKKRRYGGRGADDFYQPSYGEVQEDYYGEPEEGYEYREDLLESHRREREEYFDKWGDEPEEDRDRYDEYDGDYEEDRDRYDEYDRDYEEDRDRYDEYDRDYEEDRNRYDEYDRDYEDEEYVSGESAKGDLYEDSYHEKRGRYGRYGR